MKKLFLFLITLFTCVSCKPYRPYYDSIITPGKYIYENTRTGFINAYIDIKSINELSYPRRLRVNCLRDYGAENHYCTFELYVFDKISEQYILFNIAQISYNDVEKQDYKGNIFFSVNDEVETEFIYLSFYNDIIRLTNNYLFQDETIIFRMLESEVEI